MSNLKVVVTGSEGFLGSHLTEALVRKGYSVKAFVLYNSFNSIGWLDDLPDEVMQNCEIFVGDIRDQYSLHGAFANCDAVLHLASMIAIPYSYYSPASYVDTNVCGTFNVVHVARNLGLNKIIHTSTSEVYGTAQHIPIAENHPLRGQSPYAASKIGADAIALSYYYSFKTPVVVLRPFNTYGPRQSVRAVLPSIIVQMLRGNKVIKSGDVQPTRDFNYISDIVRGFIAALESENIEGQTINLANNIEISIRECAEYISEIIGTDFSFDRDERRIRPGNSEVMRLKGDNQKAAMLLKWTPEYSGIDGFKKGLRLTVDWFRDKKNQKKYNRDSFSL